MSWVAVRAAISSDPKAWICWLFITANCAALKASWLVVRTAICAVDKAETPCRVRPESWVPLSSVISVVVSAWICVRVRAAKSTTVRAPRAVDDRLAICVGVKVETDEITAVRPPPFRQGKSRRVVRTLHAAPSRT